MLVTNLAVPDVGAHAQDAPASIQEAASASRDAEAKELFQAGAVAFDGGRFEAALRRWREAFELSGRPALQYNIGLALDRLRRDEEAIEAFRGYLGWDSKGERATEVRGRIAAIEKALAADRAAAEKAAAEVAAANRQIQAPTPVQAAASLPVDRRPVALDTSAPSLTAQWWFWPTVGLVGAGVLVGVAAAVSGGGEDVDRDPVAEPGQLNFMALIRAPGGER